jgi:hypothetical protein
MTALQQSFWDRLVGVVTLQRPVYEALQRDPTATSQAWLIIVFLGLANGIAFITTPFTTLLPDLSPEMTEMLTFDSPERQIAALAIGVVGAVVSWYLSAWLLRVVGNRLAGSGKRATPEEMRRLVAWGYIPSLAAFFSVIPVVGQLLATLGSLWVFVTGVMAVRTAFSVGIGKAIVIEILAFFFLVAVIVILLVAAILAWSLV